MKNIISWRVWLVLLLSFLIVGCASRETREDRRAAKEERAEAKRQAREDRAAQRSGRQTDDADAAPAAKPSTKKKAAAAAPAAAAAGDATSRIVFMRPSAYGGAIRASVFDVTDSGDAKFLGIINMHTQISYPVKPGQYTFMVISESADFLQATVDGGKAYYALVIARPGAWKARFSFVPVRNNETRVDGWERTLHKVTVTPSSQAWADSNAASIASKRDHWWPAWSSKPESQRASQTLNAEDGR